MKRRYVLGTAIAIVLAMNLGGCAGGASTATSLYSQLGGMDTVNKLGSNLLSSSMKDPRLSSLLGKVDPAVAGPKVSNQLCSALGGGCKAPYTEDQIAAAGKNLTPDQKSALSENFGTALNGVTSNSSLQKAVTKSLGSKVGGIMGAIL